MSDSIVGGFLRDARGALVVSDPAVKQQLHVPGQYLLSRSQTAVTNGFGNNEGWYWAFWVGQRSRFDRLGMQVTTGGEAGGTHQCGVYESKADNTPGKLIAELGSFPTDSAGQKELVIDLTLNPGWYFLLGVVRGQNTTRASLRLNASPQGNLFVPAMTIDRALDPNYGSGYVQHGMSAGALQDAPAGLPTAYYTTRFTMRMAAF